MKIVVDTNVFISGVFFAGLPYDVLEAWRCGRVRLVFSRSILEEYQQVADELARQFPNVEFQPWVELLATEAEVVEAASLSERASRDGDDDKFLACAIAGNAKIVVSGDKDLLTVSGYAGIAVLTPRQFVERYLRQE